MIRIPVIRGRRSDRYRTSRSSGVFAANLLPGGILSIYFRVGSSIGQVSAAAFCGRLLPGGILAGGILAGRNPRRWPITSGRTQLLERVRGLQYGIDSQASWSQSQALLVLGSADGPK